MIKEASVRAGCRASRRELAWRTRSEEASDLRLSRNLPHISRLARNNEPRPRNVKKSYRVRGMRVQPVDGITSAENSSLLRESDRCRIFGRKWHVSRFLEDPT